MKRVNNPPWLLTISLLAAIISWDFWSLRRPDISDTELAITVAVKVSAEAAARCAATAPKPCR